MTLVRRVRRIGARLLPAPVRAEWKRRRAEEAAAVAAQARRERTAARRHTLLEADPAYTVFSADGTETVGRTVASFSSVEASAHNLRTVAGILEHAGIEYFLVPGKAPTRHTVGVHRSERKRFLEAARELHGHSALYAARPVRGGVEERSAYVDGALHEAIKSGLTIRFAEHLLSPEGRLLAGFDHGCDVEFWRDGAALLERDNFEELVDRLRVRAPTDVLADALVAPRPNPVGDILPTEQRKPAVLAVRGRDYPTFTHFTHKRVDEVDFPMDAVYTWVDGTDTELAVRRARYLEEGPALASHVANASRFTDHEELRYSLRSLRMYAPFVRHVYVVTDGQVPAWMDTSAEGLTVVDHRDIFTVPDALPVFSSRAIETQLHHIEGLSERYLYLNDDVFFTRPARAETFFHANGLVRVPSSPHQLGVGGPFLEEAAPNWAGKNVRALFQKDFGRWVTQKFKHVPHPQDRTLLRELEERYREDIERTARSRFRHPDDVTLTTALHHHYALLTGRGVPGEYSLRYVDIAAEDTPERLTALVEKTDVDFVCLNDFATPEERREEVARTVHDFLETLFPFPTEFERAGS